MRRTVETTARMLLIASVFVLIPVGYSGATDSDPKNYLLLKLGAYSPQHDDLDYFDKGFNGEFYYGRYFHKNFASEIGVGYFKSNGRRSFSVTSPIPSATATELLEDSLKVIDILYTIKGILPIGRLELFAGPGIGLYFAKVNSVATTTTVVPLLGTVVTKESGDDLKNAFGFHVLAGANFNITKEWFIGVEGKYFWAKTDKTLEPIAAGFFGSHLDGLVGTASMGWRF